MEKEKSLYDLFKVYNAKKEGDVKQKEATKGGVKLDYLSWAAAWEEVLKVDPKAVITPILDANGNLYHTDGKTCDVRVEVTIRDQRRMMWLPVMDHRNQSIPLNDVIDANGNIIKPGITSKNVNDSLMRCLVKCLATFGLGLSIYRGEYDTEFEKDSQEIEFVEALDRCTSYEEFYNAYQYYAQRYPKVVALPQASKKIQEIIAKYPNTDKK